MLLNEHDGNPVRTNGMDVSASPFLMIGDHAGNAIPGALERLGLDQRELTRHIAIDLGARELGLMLGEKLSAPFLWQHFSRLVCDCNRHLSDPEWAVPLSDETIVPGNTRLTPSERDSRRDEVFEPYHRTIEDALDRRQATEPRTILVSLHSFTPMMGQTERPWEICVLHDGREDAFALTLLDKLRAVEGLVVGDNEPYDMDDTDYTVPRHAYSRGIPYVELEVRQDLLVDEAGVQRIADILAPLLTESVSQ